MKFTVCLLAVGLWWILFESVALAAPLDRADFEAVIKDAWDVDDQQSKLPIKERGNKEWRVLTPDKLERLLDMPEFAALDDGTKGILIDQAGAWGLIHLQDPAQALRIWAKWFPKRNMGKPLPPDANRSALPHRGPVTSRAEDNWTAEADATVALLHCFPSAAWHIRHEEPMVWVVQHGVPWGSEPFGSCVRDLRAGTWYSGWTIMTAERNERAAGIIEKMLSRNLLEHRCTGEGPNRCLPMLHSLVSLNPNNESLPTILQAIEPDFASADGLSRTMRKTFFLSIKVPVLLEKPGAWPAGELERTIDALVDVTRARAGWPIESRRAMLDSSARRDFVDPWRLLRSAPPPAAEAALKQRGRAYASESDCLSVYSDSGGKEIPQAFWLGYAEAKFAGGQGACARDVVDNLTSACPGSATASEERRKLCQLVAQERSAAEAKAKAEEPATSPAPTIPPAPLARSAPPAPPARCADDLAKRIARSLGYLGDPQFESCKPMPNAPDASIVALSFVATDAAGRDENDSVEYDLDVVVARTENGEVLSRRLLEKADTSDAWRYTGAEIDTANYRLSPRVRAFGIRTSHSVSAGGSSAAETTLSLFVQQGTDLHRVLTDLVVARSAGEGYCDGRSEETNRTLSIAPTHSHGYADLIVHTVTRVSESKTVKEECPETEVRREASRTVLRYDGKAYAVPKELGRP